VRVRVRLRVRVRVRVHVRVCVRVHVRVCMRSAYIFCTVVFNREICLFSGGTRHVRREGRSQKHRSPCDTLSL